MHHVPIRFPSGPSLSGIGSRPFASVMRLEPQDSTMWFKGAHCPTVGAFHQAGGAFLKLLEFDRNHHPGKCAFGRFGGSRAVS